MRVWGLKFSMKFIVNNGIFVTPYAGVGIEINKTETNLRDTFVTPCAGAGIEIPAQQVAACMSWSHPVRVWGLKFSDFEVAVFRLITPYGVVKIKILKIPPALKFIIRHFDGSFWHE